MKIAFNYLLLVFTLFVGLTSCDKDDPEIPHEEELITTLIYTLTPDNGGSDVVLSFKDLDGGGKDPVIATEALQANMTYTGVIKLLNELESPAHDISEEVEEEADEHQFFFSTTVEGLIITYTDEDDNGKPLGLENQLVTGDAGSGQLTIILRHEPAKNAAGVSEGDITNAGGESDIEVTFDIDVQ